MAKEDIKSKIQKLLRLSTSPVEAEAQAALLKARELMMKYKLSELDLKEIDSDNVEIVTIRTEVTFTKHTDNWIASLADVIADHHCCRSFFTQKRRAKRKNICFMGVKDDAELVEQIFYYARHCIYSWIDKTRAEYNRFGYSTAMLRPMTDSYAKGFIAGLNEQYKIQDLENQEWGLVVVTPKEVNDYIDSLQSIDLGYNRENVYSAYVAGRQDGKSFTMRDKLSSSEINIKEVPV